MYTKTEKFRYAISDVILKRGKELVKTFNADHVRLTSSKHTRSLAAEGKFL